MFEHTRNLFVHTTLGTNSNSVYIAAGFLRMAEKKMTIKDIARLADVSPGTVDRVLHNRGKVSADKKARIDRVLEEINYQPNLIAKTLKNNKIYRIGVLLPVASYDQYWDRARQGLEKGLEEFGSFGIAIDVFTFDPEDAASFDAAAKDVLAGAIDGLLMVPMFVDRAPRLFDELHKAQVPVVTFNTYHDSEVPQTFIGQDLEQSGRVAGNLILLSKKKEGTILLLHMDEVPENAPHIADKEQGILSYFAEQGVDPSSIQKISIYHQPGKTMEATLAETQIVTKDVAAVYVSRSRAYEVADFIKQQAPEAVVVGYDLIPENARLLKEGKITYLLDQHPYQQAYFGVSLFCDHLIFGKPLPEQRLLPLHVVFRENVDSVLDSRAYLI